MSAPFYNCIKGTTSGTPGTGAFTPNAASTGFRAWSTVPTGWIGLVRYEDGTAWELTFSYWNGTTLSRASTQLFDSSTGSAISLTSSATAAMIADALRTQSLVGGSSSRFAVAVVGSTTASVVGVAVSNVGTAAAGVLATTNFLTEQPRIQLTSATSASASAGVTLSSNMVLTSTSAGHGGWEWSCSFGASQLPTAPRLVAGMTSISYQAAPAEPSAQTCQVAAFAKDSTDTNIQLMVNSNAGTATKTDTGIPLTANGWYEAFIWTDAGSTTVHALLIRRDTGDIWYGTTSTDVPTNGALMFPQMLISLNATNTGTTAIAHFGQMAIRSGL